MLAPHPFYTERGSPIAVDLMLRVLSERGDRIEILTYHEGSRRTYRGVTMHRIHPWPKVKNVPPGPSWKKIVCDFFMFFSFLKLMIKNKYDLVHAVEESSLMALVVCSIRKVPFLYDVDSSMTTQVVDKLKAPIFFKARILTNLLRFFETLPVRFAEGVITMCDALADDLRKYHPKRLLVLKDVSLVNEKLSCQKTSPIKETPILSGNVVMYIGNLEPYQGITLLLESFALAVHTHHMNVNLVLIGGATNHIKFYQKQAEKLNIYSKVHFYGPQPVEHLGHHMARADVLVSPRIHGLNTPMKVYSYLDSSAAVLATDLPTHTQVMNENIAMLVAPEKRVFAKGLVNLLSDESLRMKLATNARRFIKREHSFEAFRTKLSLFYEEVERSIGIVKPQSTINGASPESWVPRENSQTKVQQIPVEK